MPRTKQQKEKKMNLSAKQNNQEELLTMRIGQHSNVVRSLKQIRSRDRTRRRQGIVPRSNSKKHQFLQTVRRERDTFKNNFITMRPKCPRDSIE